jgi:hypothetical protein
MLDSYSENFQGNIIENNLLSSTTSKPIVLYAKDPTQTPLQTIQTVWFSKLDPTQQSNCSIQDANHPVDPKNYYEEPHPTARKTRYEIAPKPATIQSIIAASEGDLPQNSNYDYLCGSIVGSSFESSPPYFEFDDRDPSKYLFIQSFGNGGGPPIDLNSISF